jgi:hypothetical protein
MRRIPILLIVILGLMLISLTVRGQTVIDDYGTKPAGKEAQMAQVEFHVARELMRHNYSTPAQKALLVRSLRDPHAVDADMATVFTFTDAQVKEIFYGMGTLPINKFRTIYHLPTLADKKLLYLSYDKAGRGEAFRDWLAYLLVTRPMTDAKVDFVTTRLATFLDDQNVANSTRSARRRRPFSARTSRPRCWKTSGHTRVGSICKSKASGPSAKLAEAGNCVCAISHYNYSCTTHAAPANVLRPTAAARYFG